jgi:hypothetical protein
VLEEADRGGLSFLLIINYQDIQIKETEVGETCGMHGR